MQAWACEKCEKKKGRHIHIGTQHLLKLRRLIKAGYPFAKNDLSWDEWFYLGLLDDLIESKRRIF